MKLVITEKQIKKLANKVDLDIDEQDEPSSGDPLTTSSSDSGGEGYPEVGKWESGVTRGPANQIAVTKWADIVGASVSRGKANELK